MAAGLPTLTGRLTEHGRERHVPPNGQLLRYANGRPITSRRYRHPLDPPTTVTWVERNFGYAVARAYAGQTDSGSETGATATYVRTSLAEVAQTPTRNAQDTERRSFQHHPSV